MTAERGPETVTAGMARLMVVFGAALLGLGLLCRTVPLDAATSIVDTLAIGFSALVVVTGSIYLVLHKPDSEVDGGDRG